MANRKFVYSFVLVTLGTAGLFFGLGRMWLDGDDAPPPLDANNSKQASSSGISQAPAAVPSGDVLDRQPAMVSGPPPSDNDSSGAEQSVSRRGDVREFIAGHRRQSLATPFQGADVVVETAEDREYLISMTGRQQDIAMARELANARAEQAWARVPESLAGPKREQVAVAIDEMKEATIGYGLELREAVLTEIRTAPDLSQPQDRQRGAPGVPGRIALFGQRPQDASTVRLIANYFLSYDKYDRLSAAERNRSRATREMNALLDSL